MNNADLPVYPNSVENLYNAKRDKDSWERASLGITLRQHFAGLALQGIMARDAGCVWNSKNLDEVAKLCVKSADALLAELERCAATDATAE